MNFFVEIKEGLSIAWDAIRANKMRAVLTTLGIVIGIVTVTLMGTAIEALNRAFHESISVMGADVLFVSRMNWASHSEEEWQKMNKRREISLQQAYQVDRQMTTAAAVVPVVVTMKSVRYKNQYAPGVQIYGSTEQIPITGGFSVAAGRFMTAAEVEGGRPVCVIGNDVSTNLFSKESPLGKKVRIGPRYLEVIGVLDKRGSFMGMQSFDNEVIIPIKQMVLGYWRNPDFMIQVKANDLKNLEETKEELRGVMRKVRHLGPSDPDDFAINQQQQFLDTFNRLTFIIASVGFLITGLSLFVGGIGIMNIMFVSVAERTREIGVRKAIGAKRRTILLQFLIEAAAICLIGGLVGLVITYGATLIVNRFIPMTMSVPVMMMAIIVALITGVVSGFLPAWRAARMNPVDALRNE